MTWWKSIINFQLSDLAGHDDDDDNDGDGKKDFCAG
jgi:hypothetical protein